MSFAKIAKELDLDVNNTRRYYKRACKKLNEPFIGDKGRHRTADRIEAKEPEKAADFIDKVTDPRFDLEDPRLGPIKKAIEECGLPPNAANRLLARVRTQYQPVQRELQKVKTDNLVREFENLSLRALQSITQDKLDDTSAYQLALIGAIAADKRELLDGRPTERISHDDRQKLPEIIQILMQEANRRGLVKTINPETGQAGLARAEGVPVMVAAGRERVEDVEILDDLTGH